MKYSVRTWWENFHIFVLWTPNWCNFADSLCKHLHILCEYLLTRLRTATRYVWCPFSRFNGIHTNIITIWNYNFTLHTILYLHIPPSSPSSSSLSSSSSSSSPSSFIWHHLHHHRHCLSRHMATQIVVNITSGTGLLLDGTKPLHEPLLTYHQRYSIAFIWELSPGAP